MPKTSNTGFQTPEFRTQGLDLRLWAPGNTSVPSTARFLAGASSPKGLDAAARSIRPRPQSAYRPAKLTIHSTRLLAHTPSQSLQTSFCIHRTSKRPIGNCASWLRAQPHLQVSTVQPTDQVGLPSTCKYNHSGRRGPTIRIVVCWIVDLNATIRIAANCRDPDCGICSRPQDPTIRIVGS